MKIEITAEAEFDISQGYWYYEQQSPGLGSYFRDSVVNDIESLAFYAGIHEVVRGHHRMLAKRFPYTIYYRIHEGMAVVVAVLDARQKPSWIRKRLG